MDVSRRIERSMMLLRQSRFELAEQELRAAIGQEPDHAHAHALLSLCLTARDDHERALEAARRAVGLAPHVAFAHYTLAVALHDSGKPAEAEAVIRRAIELDPESADQFALLAATHIVRQQWRKALDAAEQGLASDAEHERCINMRAVALTNLGRRDEAGRTIRATLARDPENAWSHANMGWTQLHAGRPNEAATHFAEALRIEPGLEWARLGIVEALKARNFFYRHLLRISLWMSRMTPRARMAMLIGVVVVLNILTRAPQEGSFLDVAGFWLAMAYITFVVFATLANPVFNLLLRLDRFGRQVLSDDERTDSTYLAAALLAIATLIAATIAIGRPTAAMLYGLLSLAVGVTLGVPRKARRKLAAAITIALFVLAGIHCYRWGISTMPAGMTEDAALEFLLEDALRGGQMLDFVKSQRTLSNTILWSTVAMTWLGPVFRRRG